MNHLIQLNCKIDDYNYDGIISFSEPAVVTIAETTEDVVNIVKWCANTNHDIIPYGTGSGIGLTRPTINTTTSALSLLYNICIISLKRTLCPFTH